MANYIKRLGGPCCPIPGTNQNKSSIIMARFYVSDGSIPTQIYFYNNDTTSDIPIITGSNNYQKIKIDGVEVSINTIDSNNGTYILTSGQHVIEYTLKNGSETPIGMFFDCDDITDIFIPKEITTINDAFCFSSSVQSIICESLIPPTLNSDSFDFYDLSTCRIYVPCESLELYKTAQIWSSYESIIRGQDCDTPEEPEEPEEPDFIEIGGLKWATKNVGANSITDSGLYFQWGDTVGYTQEQIQNGQKQFDWANYKYSNSDGSNMTKYNPTDYLTILTLEDDAARANMGEEWVMPTKGAFESLIDATNHQFVRNYLNSGKNGYLFTDKTDNSKKLFFPQTGTAYTENGVDRSDFTDLNIWASTLGTDGTYYSPEMCGENLRSSYIIAPLLRCYGCPVRGIKAGFEI